MFDWHKLDPSQKMSFLDQASAVTGYPNQIIEKDFWVTVALKAIFDTEWNQHLVFKGGTSLSKAWKIVERFSEDIDLALDRQALGFAPGELSNSQKKRLREASAAFMEQQFMPDLEQRLLQNGMDPGQFKLEIEPILSPDVDPRVIKLRYQSIVPGDSYVRDQVLIEIGARSLKEPYTPRDITTILSDSFPGTLASDPAFQINTVLPERTFYEKVMLLHEEHCKEPGKRRHLRLSRHLFDLYRIKQSPYAESALADKELFDVIVAHRKQFNPIRGISYENHTFQAINFIPPAEVIDLWRQDYEQMGVMIFGEKPSFDEIIQEMSSLVQMFRDKGNIHLE